MNISSDNKKVRPSISVIVPIYNVEAYLEQCLLSLSKQSFNDIEVLLINDGSTDRSQKIAEKFVQMDSRFVLFNRSNHGYGAGINYGLDRAQGRYIGIVEPDDFVDQSMYEKLYSKIDGGVVDVVRCNYYEYAKSGSRKVRNVNCRMELNKALVFETIPAIWAGIYRKDFLTRAKIRLQETPGASYQDTSFHFLTTACAKSIKIEEDHLLYYRTDNPNQSTANKNMLNKAGFLVSELKYIADFFDKRPPNPPVYLRYLYSRMNWICRSIPAADRAPIVENFARLVKNLNLKVSERLSLLTDKKLRRFFMVYISTAWFVKSITARYK